MLDDLLRHLTTREAIYYVRNGVFFFFLIGMSASLTALCRKYLRILDRSNERSAHVGAVPRTGGVAIVLTFCAGILVYSWVRGYYFIGYGAFWGLFISSMVIALVSFYDDVTDRSFLIKFASQFIGVAVLLGFDLTLNEWSVPCVGRVSFGVYRYALTVLWIVGITNAFNFMDGLNGLAAGTAVIVTLFFSCICFFSGNAMSFHVGYIVAASVVGFLLFNFPKATIFMGDVGSAFLGFTIGALAILAAHYDKHHIPFMAIPILMANVILETLFTFLWRLLRGDRVFRAHRLHPYQLLHRMGVPAVRVTLIYYAQSLVLGGLCLVYLASPFPVMMGVLVLIGVLYTTYFLVVHGVARRRGVLA